MSAVNSVILVLKARGATSAHIGSKKYGKPFDRSQVAIHDAEVFYKAAEALSMKNSTTRFVPLWLYP